MCSIIVLIIDLVFITGIVIFLYKKTRWHEKNDVDEEDDDDFLNFNDKE